MVSDLKYPIPIPIKVEKINEKNVIINVRRRPSKSSLCEPAIISITFCKKLIYFSAFPVYFSNISWYFPLSFSFLRPSLNFCNNSWLAPFFTAKPNCAVFSLSVAILNCAGFCCVIAYAITEQDPVQLRIATERLNTAQFGFAVKKGANQELLQKFNDGLKKLKESGKYQEILKKYTGKAEK